MAASNMYVTVAGAGDKSGSSEANAMGLAEWQTDVENNAEAGDVYWVESGTYTLTGAWSTALDGTLTDMIAVIGMSDLSTLTEATGNDRPLIAAGANSFRFDDYWFIRNMRITSTGTEAIRSDVSSIFKNCKAENSSVVAARFGINAASAIGITVINCEGISTNGIGIYIGTEGKGIGCYAHDSDICVWLRSGASLIFSIIDTGVTAGISIVDLLRMSIVNCTVYNCGVGISGTTGTTILCWGNIIDSCTTGASWTNPYDSVIFDYNNWKNNTSDVSNVTKGPNALAVDPQFTDAPNGDFSIGANLKAAGFPGVLPGGLSTGYLDTGAVQREEAGGRRSRARYHGV